MSVDKLNLGRNVRDLDESPAYEPISCIRLITGTDQNGNQIVYTAGNPQFGRTLDVENRLIRDPTQGQQVANNILAAVQGYAYKPFSAAGAIMDPAAEIGDGVSVDEVYSVLADIETTFSPLMSANIGAPEDGSIDHEYPYESSENRLIVQEIQGLRTSFIVENGRIAAEISDVRQTQQGLSSKVTSLEMTVNGIHAYTDQEIQTISGGVVHDWAEINFTPQNISSKVSSYFDAKGAADTALANSKSYTDGKIAPIAGEYTSAIEQSAKQIMATVAAAETIWDTTTLSQTIQDNIATYGYGVPQKSTAAQYNGKYYLDQSTGTLYRSNGSKWTKQSTQLQTIQATTNSAITQQANQITSVVNLTNNLGSQVSQISQKADSISLSVSSDQYGRSTFTLSNNQTVLDTETLYLNVDAAHITGTIYANAVQAGATITSPYISGATITSSRFSDPNGVTALAMGNESWSDGFLWFGPYSSASYPSLSNSYFRVRGYNGYVEIDLGGTAFIATQQGSWRLSLGGTWDFSNATVIGL